MPSSLGGFAGYLSPFLSREALSPSYSAFEPPKLPQGDSGGVFLGLLRSFGKLDNAVNDILGHLVNVLACSLRHEEEYSTVGDNVNEDYNSK